MADSALLDPALLAPERVRPLLRREYQVLIDQGVFEDQRIELLNGVLVEMSPQGQPHARITAWFHSMLSRFIDLDIYEIRSHSPFIASEVSMPEPDVSVSWREPEGPQRHNTLLLIEVAGSSLSKDRVIKNDIYAEAGVPEYWIVDLRSSSIEVLTSPTARGYTKSSIRSLGDVLSPRKFRDVKIAVADIPWNAQPARRRRR